MPRHAGMLQASLCLLLVGASLLSVQAQQNGYPRYSPCAPPTLGDPFVVGIAYWPGGTVLEWGGAGTDPNGYPGLNPCLGDVYVNGSVVNYQTYLNDKKVYFSTYSTSVDTMTALRTTKLEEDLMFNLAKTQAAEQVISVIAFRGNIRSEAQYIRSASSITGGQGVVNRLGLIVTMDSGNLTSLNWYNFDGCNECGGADSSTCIKTNYDPVYQVTPQQSCATSLMEKACAPCVDTTCKSANCSTTTMVAFRGASKSGQPLQSAYQMEAAFKYSIYDILGSLVNDANQLGTVNVGPAGQGVSGGSGSYLQSPGASPLPLPGGQVSDAQLAAAQNGQVLPSPPPAPVPSPSPSPVTDPAATTSPVAPTTTPVAPVAVPSPPSPDYSPSTDYSPSPSPSNDYSSPSPANSGTYVAPQG